MDKRHIALVTVLAGGGAQSPITFQTATSGFFEMTFAFSAGGGPMTAQWGDGTSASHATTLQNTYPDATTKTVTISCPDWKKLTTFSCNYCNVAQTLPDFSQATSLTSLQLFGKFTSIPSTLSGLTALTNLRLRCDSSGGYTTYAAGILNNMKALATFNPSGTYMQSADFDQIMADLVSSLGGGRVACTATMSPMYYQTQANGFVPSSTAMSNAATLRTAGWTVNNVAAPAVGIIGDSIEAGSLTFFTGSVWVEMIHTAYNGGNCALHNVAVSSQGVIAGTYNMAWQAGKVGSTNALILIKLGTNDDNAGNMTTLQSTYETNLQTLKDNNPSATIYAINVLPRWTNNTTGPEVDKSNIRAAIVAACAAKSITCLDPYTSPWLLQSDMNADGLHPSAGGQAKIGAAVKTALGI
jgi:hypothetical protein